MAKKTLTHVKPTSVKVLLIGLAVLITTNILARFGILDFTSSQSNMLTVIGSLFLMAEVSAFAMIRGNFKKLNVLDMIISITALLALIGAGTSMIGMSLSALQPIQGLVDVGLLVFVLVEIFRKNKK